MPQKGWSGARYSRLPDIRLPAGKAERNDSKTNSRSVWASLTPNREKNKGGGLVFRPYRAVRRCNEHRKFRCQHKAKLGTCPSPFHNPVWTTIPVNAYTFTNCFLSAHEFVHGRAIPDYRRSRIHRFAFGRRT